MANLDAGAGVDAATDQQPERRWAEGKNGGRLLVGPSIRGPKPAVTVASELDKALRKLGGWRYFYNAAKSKHLAERIAALRVIGQRGDREGYFGESLRVVVQTLVAGANGEPVQVPIEGTCLIGENAPSAPMPTPIKVKVDDDEAAR